VQDFAVAVEAEVVGFLAEVGDGDKEVAGLAVGLLLGIAGAILGDDLVELAAFDALAFVVQGAAVVGEVVEPGVFRFATTGEDEDGGG